VLAFTLAIAGAQTEHGDASGAYVDYADTTGSFAAMHCSSEPDPLVLELCMSVGPPMWVDPMLEELGTLLDVSQPKRSTNALVPTYSSGHLSGG
jgi:hypothetical protein